MKKFLLAFLFLAFGALLLVTPSFACTVTTSPTTIPANTDTTINFTVSNTNGLYPYEILQFEPVAENGIFSNGVGAGGFAANSDPTWIAGLIGSGIHQGASLSGASVTLNATGDTNFILGTQYHETFASDVCETMITVTGSTAPNIHQLSDATINESDTYSATGSFTNPNPNATSWTATVDYGDGSGAQPLTLTGSNFSLSHQYQDNGQNTMFNPDSNVFGFHGASISSKGVYLVTVTVTDDQGGSSNRTAFVTVKNTPPTVGAITVTPSPVQINGSITASANFTDPGVLDTHTATWDWGDGSTSVCPPPPSSSECTITETNGAGSVSDTHTYTQAGEYTATLSVTDAFVTSHYETGAQDDDIGSVPGTSTTTVRVNNPPTVNPITVTTSPVLVNSAITASASFTDTDVSDTHTASWNWGDGSTSGTVTEANGSGSVSNNHTYTATGVYTVVLTVTDNTGGVGTQTYQYVAVYDSSTSFAGGRSFDNPTSASPNTTGKVMFGISAKYNNSNVLTGNAKMNFKAATLDFASTSLSSLASSNGKAYLKGSGTLNGNSGYTFLATGIDGSVVGGNDLIRFQIINSSNTVIYDSQPGAGDTADPTTVDATGNIRVH